MDCAPQCTCFCPNADLPVAPIMVPQGGPGAVVDITIYGTQGFSVSILSNPLMATSNTPVIATAQIVSGNILRITTGSPAGADTIAGYDATLRVSNACGQLDIVVHIDVVADITPVVTDCLLAQQLWVAEARVPAPGDLLLAFTPAGCRALLPPDVCAALQAFPFAAPQPNDTVFGNQGGACVGFAVADLIALAVPTCPFVATCDGSCAAPAYSFATDPTSGMFFDPASPVTEDGGPTVVIGWENCSSRLDVGESIRLTALNGDSIEVGASIIISTVGVARIITSGGVRVDMTTEFDVNTGGGFQRLNIDAVGTYRVQGTAGNSGDVLTSQGVGLPALWSPASLDFPLLAPDGTCLAPTYSFASSPDSGMFYTGNAIRISDDNCGDYIEVGASINIIGGSSATPSVVTINAGAATVAGVDGASVLISGGTTVNRSGGGVFLSGAPTPAGALGAQLGVGGGQLDSDGGDWSLASGTTTAGGDRGFGFMDARRISVFVSETPTGGTTLVLTIRETGLMATVPFESSAVRPFRATGQASGAGASAGTLTNAPTPGDPAFWLPVMINGLTRFIPAWA